MSSIDHSHTKFGRLWKTRPLKRHYDVVIIGGGIHGLATAYYLAKEHGIKDIAVLESQYIGSVSYTHLTLPTNREV